MYYIYIYIYTLYIGGGFIGEQTIVISNLQEFQHRDVQQIVIRNLKFQGPSRE